MDNKDLLNYRFEITKILGRGGLAVTYLAIDHQTGQECAIKALSLQNIDEWKTWELAEREASILKSLHHPQIPAYIDFFRSETEQDTQVYLVQEYIEGQSLAQLLHEKRHFTENEALDIAIEMSRILEYLHGFSPPIIHRDIKPANIILSDENRPFLIDFDTVKDTIQSHSQASHGLPTIVGTYGYMPLEQSEGRPVPASDIYALGMTVMMLLSQKDPSQMKKSGIHLNFRPHVNISSGLADVLEKMIAPDWQHRYQNAAELRQDLERLQAGEAPLKAQSSTVQSRPSWLKYFIAVDVLISLLIAGGIYFWLLRAPAPSAPAPSERESTPVPQQVLVTPSSQGPIIAIVPEGDRITVDIYRDFSYVPKGWPMGLSAGQSTAGGLDRRPYEELQREPKYRSKKVLYGYFQLGNGEDRNISFALDDLDRPNWSAYVDKNNNEDLTDDGPPYQNQGTGIFAAEIDVEIEIVPRTGEAQLQPYHLWMWVAKDKESVGFYARCHYAGIIEIQDTQYASIVFERFNHKGLFRESGLWIDLNQNKELDEEHEHFQDGDILHLGEEQYQLELQYP